MHFVYGCTLLTQLRDDAVICATLGVRVGKPNHDKADRGRWSGSGEIHQNGLGAARTKGMDYVSHRQW
jgi:hypothetical protein